MDRSIEVLRKKAAQEYPALYRRMIQEWKQEGQDAFWLIYSANYLFRWDGARWAVDHLTLSSRIPAEFPVHPEVDFENTDFIVLTHRHSDHLDHQLLKAISNLDIQWVIPEFLLDDLTKTIHLPDDQIIVPKPGEPIELSGVTILPLEGSHWECSAELQSSGSYLRGIPAFSYLFETNNKRWFLPGDIRSYTGQKRPGLGHLDGIIAHVWLGRKGALLDPPLLLEQFCNYHLGFKSSKIVLTHLEEWGRNQSDLWTKHHADMIMDRIYSSTQLVRLVSASTGDCVLL